MTCRRTRLVFSTGLAVLGVLFFIPLAAAGQLSDEKFWGDVDSAVLRAMPAPETNALRYRTSTLDLAELDIHLATVPLEHGRDLTVPATAEDVILSLPRPDGVFERFRVVESPIMEAGLAAKFPEIKTYRGVGIDAQRSTVRFDRTPAGFHAMISSPEGRIFIDPYHRGETSIYISYWAHEVPRRGRTFSCGVDGGHDTSELVESHRASQRGGAIMLHTYRAAIAATGEYTAFHGGTVPQGQAAIVTAMNRVNEIYERDVAIRMVLVANNDAVVYTDGNSDPYTNEEVLLLQGENQDTLDEVIGNANYDIGHVFSTGAGGIALFGTPCKTGLKARAATGLEAPIGDPFWIDFVAHEMGHQWAGNHTFNGDEGSCEGEERNPATAYEPGSGTTVLAYAGICGSQNLQRNSDSYFHGISLDEIIAYSRAGEGNTCAMQSPTGNNPPVVEAGPAYTIPLDTAFELCGSATDADPLTYAWEEFDLGPAGAPNQPVGDAAIFRSFPPVVSPCRTFPRMADLAAGAPLLGEILPTYARTLNFRLTARDNRAGGGAVGDDTTTVVVSDAAGPFRVTFPDTLVSLPQGSAQNVTWDVAGTDAPPINCTSVDILLSTDGGLTYPTTLATSVANTGTSSVSLPNLSIFEARVQVRCAGQIFFDISDVDFGIGVPLVTIGSPTSGATVTLGDPVSFTGAAVDPEDGDLSAGLNWTSSLDGPIGSGGSFQISSLSLGSHTITASATDSDTNTNDAMIVVNVEPACVDLLDEDGFEVDNDGWIDGASTCTTGHFIRGTPDEVIDEGITTQPDGAASGSFAWFTANNLAGAGIDDVDGGTCETLSPVVNVGSGSFVTVFVDYFHGQRDSGTDAEDGFTLELIDATTGAVLETLVDIGDVTTSAVWTSVWTQHADAPANVRLRVRATDGESAGGDLIEAGIDNVRICSGDDPGTIFQDGFESGGTTAWSAMVP